MFSALKLVLLVVFDSFCLIFLLFFFLCDFTSLFLFAIVKIPFSNCIFVFFPPQLFQYVVSFYFLQVSFCVAICCVLAIGWMMNKKTTTTIAILVYGHKQLTVISILFNKTTECQWMHLIHAWGNCCWPICNCVQFKYPAFRWIHVEKRCKKNGIKKRKQRFHYNWYYFASHVQVASSYGYRLQ